MIKYILAFLLLGATCAGVNAQGTDTATNAGKQGLSLKESTYHFGKIVHGKPVTHEFQVFNTGSDTLTLENVQASCGCTTPVWKKDPVPPGGQTTINVGFNAGTEGRFNKQVTIYFNGGQTKTLTITGDVFKSPATPAPTNSSITLLKQSNN